jgi:FeS assembly SUF system protein
MGIFSFLTGDRNNQDTETSDSRKTDGWSGDAASPAASLPERPAATPEPGAGISDFEPAPFRATAATGDPDQAQAASSGQVAPQALPFDDPAFDAPRPGDSGGEWDLGALVAPPPASDRLQIEVGSADAQKTLELKPSIVDALSTIYDPEIPVNIYELGLIYDVIIDAQARVLVRMTLTSPACPSAQQLPSEVQYKVKAVSGISDVAVDVVWEPPWTKDMMSDAAKLSLGIW